MTWSPRADHKTKAPMSEPLPFDPANCPIRNVLDRLGDQWSLLVLEALDQRIWRFNELSREIGDISRQMLAKTLRRLEEDGLVTRTIHPEVPPRVEYALTDLGRSMMGPIRALTEWADSNHGAVQAARRDFAAREG